ncbi:MAG: metallophosphoesterase [Deltaproteobacteria bacterium]|nr:metallophosphoesterase [Deltaproteobacteria bacterium]
MALDLPRMDAWRRRFTRRVVFTTWASQTPLLLTAAMVWKPAAISRSLWVTLLLVGMLVGNLPLYLRMLDWRDHTRRSLWRVWALELPYFALFASGFAYAILSVLSAPLWLIASAMYAYPLANSLAIVAVMSWLVGSYAVFVRRLWPETKRVEVHLEDLDPSLDGFVITQVSDVHCGPYIPRWFLMRVARLVCESDADLCAVTGDMITEGEGYLPEVTAFVSALKARHGVYACLGNHDYFGTIEGARAAMTLGGAAVLCNEGARVGELALFVAGVDDAWTKRSDEALAMAQCPSEFACILLSHDPTRLGDLAAHPQVRLVLSGHTHAGQLAVPFVSERLNVGRLKFARSVGLFALIAKRTWLYVHPGVGTSGPPVRLGVAPTVTTLVLRASGPTR